MLQYDPSTTPVQALARRDRPENKLGFHIKMVDIPIIP